MKAVLQRVKSASVTVDGEIVSSIGRGILVLVGIAKEDTEADIKTLASKIVRTKMWENEQGQEWRQSVREINGEILCVSQFTLFASTKKPKPDFHRSAPAIIARDIYTRFFEEMQRLHGADMVKDGRFQEMMDVTLTNDGPVTYIIDTENPSATKPVDGPGGQ